MKTDRRDFLKTLSLGSAGALLSSPSLLALPQAPGGEDAQDAFKSLCQKLLEDWSGALLRLQILAPGDSTRHGAIACPACDFIHGRGFEAVYPFMRMARTTGDGTYLRAAIAAMEWSQNVTTEDGRWTNELDPKSWPGTTIFAAIALAESLYYHGDLLDDGTRTKWTQRLEQAANGFLFHELNRIDYANINYGFISMHGFHLIGKLLNHDKLLARSHEFADLAKTYFTETETLLYGEGKPIKGKSSKGLRPVDLGYNVEESLNGAVLYALEMKDEPFLDLLERSMVSHLEFVLPDGAWDNSWGTRQAKWSYWGSRTSDGCQPAFSLMADRDPRLGSAAYRNALLLQQCTTEGLLHGGPHYVSHGIKPCVHHTFAHAKAVALVMDKGPEIPQIDITAKLPRDEEYGTREITDLAVSLVSRGPWRATISAYDFLYGKGDRSYLQQATGGSLAVLYHDRVGPLMTASMAEYIMIEDQNMQPQPGEDYPLTSRIETYQDGKWFTNLYDLEAEVEATSSATSERFLVKTSLKDREKKPMLKENPRFIIEYSFSATETLITLTRPADSHDQSEVSLVVPIVSPSGEKVNQKSPQEIELTKPKGQVIIKSSGAIAVQKTEKGRIFNMVPGMEAVPLSIRLPDGAGSQVTCSIQVT